MVQRHVRQIVKRRVQVNQIIHIAIKAIICIVKTAECEKRVKHPRETEEQVDRMCGAQACTEGHHARVALPAAFTADRADIRHDFFRDVTNPLLMPPDAHVGIA